MRVAAVLLLLPLLLAADGDAAACSARNPRAQSVESDTVQADTTLADPALVASLPASELFSDSVAAPSAQPDSLPKPASTPQPNVLVRAQAKRESLKAHKRYDDTFRRYSKRYFGAAFDWRWFKAQGMAESDLDSSATSHVGARGVMQLMPATYQAIQSKRPEFGAIDDPEWNIAAGIMHDRYLWKLWEKQVGQTERYNFMFASYNAGERTIGRAADSARVVAGGPPAWLHVEQVAPRVPRWRYRETLGYVRKIDTNYEKLKRQR